MKKEKMLKAFVDWLLDHHFLVVIEKKKYLLVKSFLEETTQPDVQMKDLNDLRWKAITGTFIIGDSGIKVPPNWEFYANRLEEMILAGEFSNQVPQTPSVICPKCEGDNILHIGTHDNMHARLCQDCNHKFNSPIPDE